MQKKKVQFSLVYRDMFQSSGKFQPRKDQLERVAPAIIDMGCFARVETNGGAFEQVNLLYGENPNKAVRAFTAPFNKVGIKTHMLDRGLNALRMFPVPADVRKLMYKVKHAQGVDIPRIFCGLNDVSNIIPSIQYAKDGGMTPQATLCITTSPIHTAEYYFNIAEQLIKAGAPEICLKDMAGIGQPAMLGKLTAMIKNKYPEIIIQYHGHSGPGLSMASILEVCKAGADVIDTAVEPLAWGKVHPDVISVQSMLKYAGFDVAEINMDAYMEVRKLTQEFIDDFLGYFMSPSNKLMSSLLLGCGLPGGMMGSMMSDLKGVESAINSNRSKAGLEPYTEDQLLKRIAGSAGLAAHLGTTDILEITRLLREGDAKAKLLIDAMIYHTAKCIASEGAVLRGHVDAILLTGGIAHSDYITSGIRSRVDYLAPVHIFPGENEMEALALNALAVLRGERAAQIYK